MPPKTQLGPVDDQIRRVVEFVAARRSRAYSSLTEKERLEFRGLIKVLDGFVFKVGYFSTPHVSAIDAAYEFTVADLVARIGKFSWLVNIAWILKTIARGTSMSGWLVQELRERIRIITTDGPIIFPSSISEEALMRRLDEVAPAFVRLRRVHKSCELARHKRNKKLEQQGYCERGCDVVMLEYLKFHPILIGRVLGLKLGTTRNRLDDCRAKLQSNAKLAFLREVQTEQNRA